MVGAELPKDRLRPEADLLVLVSEKVEDRRRRSRTEGDEGIPGKLTTVGLAPPSAIVLGTPSRDARGSRCHVNPGDPGCAGLLFTIDGEAVRRIHRGCCRLGHLSVR